MITRLDLVGIPSQDPDRARSFHRDTLGLRAGDADYEQCAGDTCFGIWEPEKVGMPFVAQKGNPWALGCDDVAATRAELEAKGVEFAGDILDTGVCHVAFFSDPDGNDLTLHTATRPMTDRQARCLLHAHRCSSHPRPRLACTGCFPPKHELPAVP